MDPITQDQARTALADIEATGRRMRRALSAASFGGHLTLWGLVWVIGFTATYLWPTRAGLAWLPLTVLGVAGSTWLGIRERLRPRAYHPGDRNLGRTIGLFWMVVIVDAQGLAWSLPGLGGADRLLVLVVVLMLGYVALGLWTRSPLLTLVGLGVSLAAAVGWKLLGPRDYMLWMAVFGGGGLLLPGVWSTVRWR